MANITAVVSNNTSGYINAFAGDAENPGYIHSLDWYSSGGRYIANSAIIGLNSNNNYRLYTNQSADILIDIFGYLSDDSSGGGVFQPLNSSNGRLYNTTAGGTRMLPNQTRTIPVWGQLNIPSSATAVVVNLTAGYTAGAGYLNLYPTWQSNSPTSVVDWDYTYFGNVTTFPANFAIIPIGYDGRIAVTAGGTPDSSTDVIIDVLGYIDSTNSSSNNRNIY